MVTYLMEKDLVRKFFMNMENDCFTNFSYARVYRVINRIFIEFFLKSKFNLHTNAFYNLMTCTVGFGHMYLVFNAYLKYKLLMC